MNIEILPTKIILQNEQDSVNFARQLAAILKRGDIIAFKGDLGCGKTFICRSLIKYFCGESTNVTSPTFNLVQLYKTSEFTIYHFDLYRLKSSSEIYELGFEEALSGLCLIEWPEIIEELLPKPYLLIELQILPSNVRSCTINKVI